MARVKGPLFSIAASGSIAGLLTFNPGKKSTTARRQPAAYPPPSANQLATRQKVRDAAAAWRALDPLDRAEWSVLAHNSGRLPFAKYLLEWFAQACTPTTPPYIPMA